MPASLSALLAEESHRFRQLRPNSAALAGRAAAHWPGSVPMHWMGDWDTPHPLFVRRAAGIRVEDVDGLAYRDFCLGDTAAMFGHSPPPVAAAIAARSAQGLSCMLPAERVAAVGELLAERFRLPFWQVTQTATDANKAALRWARAITGRQRVLVFQGCYHGTLDETLVRLRAGRTQPREGLIGAPFAVAEHTVAVEFDDVDGLQRELARGDIAAVLCEPVMTNVGMVLPPHDFHTTLRRLTRRYGSLLVIDETHTLSSGLGGYTRVHGLEPDLWTCGKAIAGGMPCAVFGFSGEVEAGMRRVLAARDGGHSGMGTTLAANALAIDCLHACLAEVMTPENHARMDALAARLAHGYENIFTARDLLWHVSRVGARVEYGFGPPPRNGTQAQAAMRPQLEHIVHLWLMNRGFLVTPFHNMMLTTPVTSEADVDALVEATAQCLDALDDEVLHE